MINKTNQIILGIVVLIDTVGTRLIYSCEKYGQEIQRVLIQPIQMRLSTLTVPNLILLLLLVALPPSFEVPSLRMSFSPYSGQIEKKSKGLTYHFILQFVFVKYRVGWWLSRRVPVTFCATYEREMSTWNTDSPIAAWIKTSSINS